MVVAFGGDDDDVPGVRRLVEGPGQQGNDRLHRRGGCVLLGDEVIARLPSGPYVLLEGNQHVEQHRVEGHALIHEAGDEVVEGSRVAGDGRDTGSESGFRDAGVGRDFVGDHSLPGNLTAVSDIPDRR